MRNMSLPLLQRRYVQPAGEGAFKYFSSAGALTSCAMPRGEDPPERSAWTYMAEKCDVGGFDPDVMLSRRRALRAPVAAGIHADEVVGLTQPRVVPLRTEPGRVEQDGV